VKLADGQCPVVTPDGRSAIFISDAGGVHSPWIVSLETGKPTQIANFYAGNPGVAVSLDGLSIAFWSQDGKQRILRTCTIAECTGTSRTLTAAPPGSGRLRYTHDRLSIAYVDPAKTNIWLLPLAGGAPHQLTHFTDGRTIDDFAWSRDGKHLAVSRATTATDIVLFKGLSGKR
jgi:Tol biopolymer transport system component